MYRFEKQLKVFENRDVDICSSWVSEFDNDENTIISYRKIPKEHAVINFTQTFRSKPAVTRNNIRS